jgi:hypothetical protein
MPAATFLHARRGALLGPADKAADGPQTAK